MTRTASSLTATSVILASSLYLYRLQFVIFLRGCYDSLNDDLREQCLSAVNETPSGRDGVLIFWRIQQFGGTPFVSRNCR